MRSILLIVDTREVKSGRPADQASLKFKSPLASLKASGYNVVQKEAEEYAALSIHKSDATVLHMSMTRIAWLQKAWTALLNTPILWWCSDETANASAKECETGLVLDGILAPGMKSQEIHWTLYFSAKHSMERRQWAQERQQLIRRLEERKWIDIAKGILCEMKKISEAEAYDLLRTQAMHERKRIVDVASSIVKAYQLLQGRSK